MLSAVFMEIKHNTRAPVNPRAERRCGNDTEMKVCWYLFPSTSQVWWWFISSAEPRGQVERVGGGRGMDADLLVMNISCVTVTGDAGTLARAAWQTARHRKSAARFPFPLWQPGLLRWRSAEVNSCRAQTLKPISLSHKYVCFHFSCIFAKRRLLYCSRCRATSTRCARLSERDTHSVAFLLP